LSLIGLFWRVLWDVTSLGLCGLVSPPHTSEHTIVSPAGIPRGVPQGERDPKGVLLAEKTVFWPVFHAGQTPGARTRRASCHTGHRKVPIAVAPWYMHVIWGGGYTPVTNSRKVPIAVAPSCALNQTKPSQTKPNYSFPTLIDRARRKVCTKPN